jgi:hypothetical protein
MHHRHTPHVTLRLLRAAAMGAALVGSLSVSRAIAPIGDSAELFITGNGSFTYNDNLFLVQGKAKSDEVWDIAPGLDLEFGKNAAFKGSVTAGVDWQLYSSHSSLNTALGTIAANGNYDDGKTKLAVQAAWQQADQPTVVIRSNGSLINRDVYTLGGTGEEVISEKTSLGGGISFTDTSYKTPGYADDRSTTIPVNYYYQVEPKLDVSGGFQYRYSSVNQSFVQPGTSTRDYFYNIGARGQFTPLLSGTVRIGYEDDQAEKGKDNRTLAVDSSFTYAYTEKTSFSLNLDNDYGFNALGQEYRSAGGSIGVTTKPMEQLSFNGSLGYHRLSYTATNQRDDFYNISVGATYSFSPQISASGNYSYQEDNSNFGGQSFKQNVFIVSGTVHY